MTLLWPFMLGFLVLIPILVLVYLQLQRRRQRYALRYASLALVKEAIGPGPGWRRHIPPALFGLSLTVMILALARPVAEVKVPSYEGTIILAMDVSGSMTANDLDPSRLDAARAAAHEFVTQEPGGVRIGVVAFSNFAALIQPPTSDKDQVLAAINRLQPQRGTAIGQALVTSMAALQEAASGSAPAGGPVSGQPTAPISTPAVAPGSYTSGIVVLLSDGQNTVGADPILVMPRLQASGIRVYTVGIGTAEGTILRLDGRSMRVRLDDATLRELADGTGGRYYNATTEKDLHQIYQNLGRQLGFSTERTELTAFATSLAAALALAGGTLSLLWFNRLP